MAAISEVWTIGQVLDLYHTGRIIKPRIQRRHCWDDGPERGRTNCADFLTFVRSVGTCIAPMIFVQKTTQYVLIDGNNRLNALCKLASTADLAYACPVVIFQDMPDSRLIEIYEKINITGVKLTANDILAAKTSMIVYTELPGFAELHAKHVELATAQPEALRTAITPYLTQYEVLAAKQAMCATADWFKTADGWIFDWCRAVYGPPDHPVDLARFLGDVDAKLHWLQRLPGEISGQFYREVALKDAAWRCACLGATAPQLALANIIGMFKARVGGRINLARVEAKSHSPLDVPMRTTAAMLAAIQQPMPPRDVLVAILTAVLREADRPAEQSKRGKYAAIVRLLLSAYHTSMMPPIVAAAADKKEIEHIVPFSTRWAPGIKLDINRLGNLTIIPEQVNLSRGNNPLTEEYLRGNNLHYAAYPTETEYCTMVDKTRLADVAAYVRMAERRESMYIDHYTTHYLGHYGKK
jgi:hypothetical protein